MERIRKVERKTTKPLFLYMIKLLYKYKTFINFNEYKYCIDILKQFYIEYCKCTLTADALYNALYNLIYKDYKEGKSIFDYVDEVETEETILYMWEIILLILLIIVRMAYENECIVYVPEDIECIRIEKIYNFIEQVKLNKTPKELLEHSKEICY